MRCVTSRPQSTRLWPPSLLKNYKPMVTFTCTDSGHNITWRHIPIASTQLKLAKALHLPLLLGPWANVWCVAKCIQLMIMNNLDNRVAQFPHELITYGGNGAVFQNWYFWTQTQFSRWLELISGPNITWSWNTWLTWPTSKPWFFTLAILWGMIGLPLPDCSSLLILLLLDCFQVIKMLLVWWLPTEWWFPASLTRLNWRNSMR